MSTHADSLSFGLLVETSLGDGRRSGPDRVASACRGDC
jgi:hypothetical protein